MQIEANGIRMEYRIDGREGAPWVTLATGIANDLSMWDGQIAALASDLRVLRYDLRGQGGSEAAGEGYSIELLAADLVALWDALGIAKSHLAGLGLGGSMIHRVALDHPERLLSLVPCCCRAKMVPEMAAMWHKLIAAVGKEGIEPIVEPTAQRWFSEDFKAANPAAMDAVRKMIRGTSVAGYLGCVNAFLGLDIEEELHLIRTPTRYIGGADDHVGGPMALMQGLAAKVPGARYVAVPGAAHIANLQNPAGFNAALSGYLKSFPA
jgi:3-oxoadipate enol-lactonase